MTTFVVTTHLDGVEFVEVQEANYSIDAINTVIDNLADEWLDDYCGNLTISCRVKS